MAKTLKPQMTKQERIWEAQDDMRTLARAEEIKADKARMKRAHQMGAKMAQEKRKEAQAMERAARMKPGKPKRKK